LAYSFSEAAHVKGSWLVELDAAGLGAVELVPAPVPRRLSTLRGRLDALLTDPRLTAQEGDYLSVVLTDPVRPDDPMVRLRSRFAHVLVLDWQPEGAVVDERSYAARMAGRDDLDIVTEFVRHVRGGGSTSDAGAVDEQDRALLDRALEAGRLAAASA
jgi:exonuclease SbcD